MKSLDVPIIALTYKLNLLLSTSTKTIPKFERHTIWERVVTIAILILEQLLNVGSAKNHERPILLERISNKLDLLKLLVRLSFDAKAIGFKKYVEIEKILDEIGKMLGGWIKSLKT